MRQRSHAAIDNNNKKGARSGVFCHLLRDSQPFVMASQQQRGFDQNTMLSGGAASVAQLPVDDRKQRPARAAVAAAAGVAAALLSRRRRDRVTVCGAIARYEPQCVGREAVWTPHKPVVIGPIFCHRAATAFTAVAVS